MAEVVAAGRSVEEAVDKALLELGATHDEVEVEVLSAARRGLLGVFGGKEVRVCVRTKERKADYAAEYIRQVGDFLELPVSVTAHEEDDGIAVDVRGEGLGLLIGRGGETLTALQVLVNSAASKATGDRRMVLVDVEGYRRRREQALEHLARRMAARAARNRQEVVLRPMSSHERRCVHLALKDNNKVSTASRGEDPFRQIVITPKSG